MNSYLQGIFYGSKAIKQCKLFSSKYGTLADLTKIKESNFRKGFSQALSSTLFSWRW